MEKDNDDIYPAKTIKYSVSNNVWYQIRDISIVRDYRPCLFLIDNHLYVVGGCNIGTYHSTMESYYLSGMNERWHTSVEMPDGRTRVVCVTLENNIVVLAGGDDGLNTFSSALMWTPGNTSWTQIASMNEARSFACSVSDGHQFMYVLGGYNGQHLLASVERYDIQFNTWMLLSSMPSQWEGHACVYIDGTIIVSGGDRGKSDIYDSIFLYFGHFFSVNISSIPFGISCATYYIV